MECVRQQYGLFSLIISAIASNIVILIGFHAPLFAQTKEQLKSDIQQSLEEQKLTGAVWSVVYPNGEILTDCAGIKNTSTNELLKATDKVHVGSITKTVLAAGVLRLVTQGLINLDDPVNKYLFELKFINPWESTNPVTVRHLLDHTSGLSDLRLWHFFSTSSTPNTPLSAFYKKDPEILKIQSKPGTIFSYSNTGYTILGMLIEAVTNQRYEKYLDENLLAPLGMSNSTFQFVSQEGAKADKFLAMGHLDQRQTVAALPIYLRSAGQFTTTAYDMGLLLKFMISNGTVRGKEFINNDLLKQVGVANNTEASQLGLPIGYGFGAFIRDRHGVSGIAHSGNIVGYHAMIYMFPSEQKAFFISHNMDSEVADYEVFNKILIKHLEIGDQYKRIEKAQTDLLSSWNGYYTPVITKVIPFGWVDLVTSFTKVTMTSFGAELIPFQKEPVMLSYLGNNKFIADGKTLPSHVFYKNDTGQFIATGLSTIKKVNGIYILLASISIIAGLSGLLYLLFSGTYQVIVYKKAFWKQPISWSYLSLFFLFLSVPFLLSQTFMAMGDKTIGSIILAIATALLPVFILISIIRYFRYKSHSILHKADLLFLIFVFQFLIVLAANDLIPFMLWK